MGELSSRLVADGHQVTVATSDAHDFELFWDPRRRRFPAGESQIQGVHVHRFPVRHMPISRLSYPAWRRLLWIGSRIRPLPIAFLARAARQTPLIPRLWHWLATTSQQFDLVAGMTICFEPLLDAGLQFARTRELPFVAYPLTHLGAGPRPGADSLSSFYTMRHQVNIVLQSDALVAQTPTERDFYVQRGLPIDRTVVAGPGVSPDRLAGGDGRRFRSEYDLQGPIVACIGSMAFDKGTVHLVEAMQVLWRQGLDVTLILAGALLAPFRRLLANVPDEDKAKMVVLDSIDESTKLDLLDAMDIFAMPSRTDSFGITYLEAWTYGKPVIGARVWGIDDVIRHGEDGLLVPFGDPAALARSLLDLLHDSQLSDRLGERGREKVMAEQTWEAKYDITRTLYERLAASGRSS
jgi:glycosyltransferase involved in cell wall biosynthesis